METRERLVELATDAMRRVGYDAFSYGALARAAGIRKASIHHHFPAKADLGLAVLDGYADSLAARFDSIAERRRTGGGALQDVLAHYRSLLGEGDRLCLCAALSADRPSLDARLTAMLARADAMTISRLADFLRKGRSDRSIAVAGDPANEAHALLAQLYGAQLLARSSGDVATYDRAMQPFAARISAGAA